MAPLHMKDPRTIEINMLKKLESLLSSFVPDAANDTRDQPTLQVATTVLLIELMQSDNENAAEEQALILRILKQRFQLSDAEVQRLTERGHKTSQDANDLHQFTRLLNQELILPEKIQIVEYLWQIAYADGEVSAHENHLMRRLVDLLHISIGDNAAAKSRARDRMSKDSMES